MNATKLLTSVDQALTGPNLQSTFDIVGRVGLAAIFLLAGISKVQNFSGTAQYMASVGLPEALLPLVIAFEIGAAIALIIGFQTRLVAISLAIFCVVSGFIFHGNLEDQMQFILFYKNIAMAGGFLVLGAHGAGKFSLDAKLLR